MGLWYPELVLFCQITKKKKSQKIQTKLGVAVFLHESLQIKENQLIGDCNDSSLSVHKVKHELKFPWQT